MTLNHDPGPKRSEAIQHDYQIWRGLSIPAWRRILQESVDAKEEGREKYARWMLKVILEADDELPPH